MTQPAEIPSFPSYEAVEGLEPGILAYTFALRGLMASVSAHDNSERAAWLHLTMGLIVEQDEKRLIKPPLSKELSSLVHATFTNGNYYEDSEEVVFMGSQLPRLRRPTRRYLADRIEVAELILGAVVRNGNRSTGSLERDI